MDLNRRTARLLDTAPDDDQGSEAMYGFDYQAHCASRLCLDMIESNKVLHIACEYHEDIVEFYKNGAFPCYCQVKKRESANALTLALLSPAVCKLLRKAAYKDVGGLRVIAHGRPGSEGVCSLQGLIALLDCESDVRNADWDALLVGYEKYFLEKLDGAVDSNSVRIGLRKLKIELSHPSPDAIEFHNIRMTVGLIKRVWGVEPTYEVAEEAYRELYLRVWKACNRPKQPLSVKRITAVEARSMLVSMLKRHGLLAANNQALLDTSAKLIRGRLEDRLEYALKARMDAMQAKHELDLDSMIWQDLKDDILHEWEQCRDVGSTQGIVLWCEVRGILKAVAATWERKHDKSIGTRQFAEGVFFDMLATCSVHLTR